MSKLSRHKAIRDLLHESPVPSQEELQRLLHRRGFDAGQATLSRDVRELGLVKSSDGYALPGGESTSVGSAQPVAAALDGENWSEAIGTIAGDDTILIVCQDRRAAGRLADRIQGMLA
jgi:transcriptional regulator of arginine metabolism